MFTPGEPVIKIELAMHVVALTRDSNTISLQKKVGYLSLMARSVLVAMLLFDTGGPDGPPATLSEVYRVYNSYSKETGVLEPMRSTDALYTNMELMKGYMLVTKIKKKYEHEIVRSHILLLSLSHDFFN